MRKKFALLLSILAFFVVAFLPANLNAATPETAVVGIKLMKAENTEELKYNVRFPSNCSSCKLLSGDDKTGQNRREIYFHVEVPKNPTVVKNMIVTLKPDAVREIIIEKSRVPFQRLPEGVRFDMPVQSGKPTTTELHTHLEMPGVDIRIEHAFEDRRAGKYSTGSWPALEVQAALNLEFGQREAILMLGLDKDVVKDKLGMILLMGFDTNYPFGHTDWPAHMHMHLMWPHMAGSQIGHYYINDKGLLTHNIVSIYGLWDWPGRQFDRGQKQITIDYRGRGLYHHTITPEGWLLLERESGGECLLKPAGEGFHQDVIVDCKTKRSRRVKVRDDVTIGELRVWVDDAPPEVYRYDVDTAVLLR